MTSNDASRKQAKQIIATTKPPRLRQLLDARDLTEAEDTELDELASEWKAGRRAEREAAERTDDPSVRRARQSVVGAHDSGDAGRFVPSTDASALQAAQLLDLPTPGRRAQWNEGDE